jgi:hypothetical protein
MGPRIALFNDTSVTNHYGCTAVMSALIRGLEARGGEIAFRWPVAVDWQPSADLIAERDFDVLVVNGEGSIHHSIDRPRARQLCALGPFARDRLGVPAYLINASIEALEIAEIENLKAFRSITVRESTSAHYLDSHGIESSVAGDLSFATRQPAVQTRAGVLVTDSVLQPVSESLTAVAKAINAEFVPMRERKSTLDRLKKIFFSKPTPPLEGPLAADLLPRLDLFLEKIAQSELVITGRFHSVCLSLLLRTPVLAVPSNSAKISAILQDALGSSNRVLEPNDLGQIDKHLARAQWGERETAMISKYLDNMIAIQNRTFDAICTK